MKLDIEKIFPIVVCVVLIFSAILKPIFTVVLGIGLLVLAIGFTFNKNKNKNKNKR